MSNVDVVRQSTENYNTQNREAAEKLIAADYRFTSPQDDHIDRAAFFEVCFPTADRFASSVTKYIVEVSENDVLHLYEYELADGSGTYRNVELNTLRDGQIVETQVFFGGRVG